MGPCHWMQMFSVPHPEYTCPIKLTLTPPSTEQTSLLQTLHCSNLFWVKAPRITVCPHVVNTTWCYQTPGKGTVTPASGLPMFGPSFGAQLVLSLFGFLPFCWLFDGKHLLKGWVLEVEAAKPQQWRDERTVGEGLKGGNYETLTGASSAGLWERQRIGNVCKWEQGSSCPYPFIKSFSASTPPPSQQ